jgi:hypothetical protein
VGDVVATLTDEVGWFGEVVDGDVVAGAVEVVADGSVDVVDVSGVVVVLVVVLEEGTVEAGAVVEVVGVLVVVVELVVVVG